jgi:uncharacterized protein
MKLKKAIYIVLGTLSLIFGVIGILVPGLPTTPFLLLTAALYLKSSEKLYAKLVNNPYLGKYVLRYKRRGGMTQRQKIYAISLMWIMILISCFLIVESKIVTIIVLILGLVGTVVMGFFVPQGKE